MIDRFVDSLFARRRHNVLVPCVVALLVVASACIPDARASGFVETSGDVLRYAIPAAAFAMTYKRHDQNERMRIRP